MASSPDGCYVASGCKVRVCACGEGREAVERGSSGKGGDTVEKGGRQWEGGSGEGSSGEGEGESAHMHVGGSFFHVQVLVLWCMKCAVQHQRCLFNGIEGVPARCLFNGIEGVPARKFSFVFCLFSKMSGS